jgi:hypothetical protein
MARRFPPRTIDPTCDPASACAHEPKSRSKTEVFNWKKDLVGQGITLVLLLSLLIQVPLAMGTYGISLLLSGITQFLYLTPIIAIAHQKGYDGIVKGMIIMASLTFLFSAIGVAIFISI